jgi:DNA-binding transcriptional MerR regulator
MSDEVMGNESVQEPVNESVQDNVHDDNRTFTQDDLERIVEQRLMRERKKYEKKLEGVDLDEARRLLQEKEQAEIERQKEKGEFEKVLQQLAEKKDSEISQYKTRLQEIQVDGALINAASQNGAVSPDQVVALLKNQTRLADDGSVEILDKDGTVRYNDSGTPMGVNDLVSEFLTANPHFVKASPSGTGSKGAAGGSTQKPSSVADMLANWENGGRQAYATLKGKRT